MSSYGTEQLQVKWLILDMKEKSLTIKTSDEKYTFRAASRKNIFLGFEVLIKEDKGV